MKLDRSAYTQLSQSPTQENANESSSKFCGSISESGRTLLPFHILEPKTRHLKFNPYSTMLLRRLFHLVGLAFGVFGCVLLIAFIRTSLHPQPSYILLSKARYHETLLKSIKTSFPSEIQKELEAQLKLSMSTRDVTSDPIFSLQNTLPRTLWQTDKYHPPETTEVMMLQNSWERAGINETVFLDDVEALDKMKRLYNDSEVSQTYFSLPAPVLKADMLRYSLLLSEGGIYR